VRERRCNFYKEKDGKLEEYFINMDGEELEDVDFS